MRHPNLVTLLDRAFDERLGWVFTMELVRGVPLDAWLGATSTSGEATVDDAPSEPTAPSK